MWWTELSTEEDKMEDNWKEELSKISDEHKVTPISVGAGLETKPLATLEHEMLTGLEPKEGDLWTNCDTGNAFAWNGDKWVDTAPVELKDIEAPTLELYHSEPAQMVAFEPNNNFIIMGDDGKQLVCIDMGTGKTTLGPEYNPDDAARVFWNCIEQFKQPDAGKENANIAATEVLRDVRRILGAEEGEDILDVAKQVIGDAGHKPHCNWYKWDHKFSWSGDDCTCDAGHKPHCNWHKWDHRFSWSGDDCTCDGIINCPYIPEKFSINDAEQTFDDAMKVID